MNLKKIKIIFILNSFLMFSSIVSMDHEYSRYDRIPSKVEAIFKNNNNSNLNLGMEIYSIKNNKVIYAYNQDHKFIPASNTKIFTSLCALDFLGTEYQFKTQLLTDGVIQENTINGNIYLKGSGDPSLTSENLENLINKLSDNGVQIITGDFCIDHDQFDHEGFAPGTTIDDLGEHSYFNPINSLIINHKASGLHPINIVSFTDNKKMENMFFDLAKFLEEILDKYNIKLHGSFNFKKSERNFSLILEHVSEKLPVLLSHLNKNSDNLYADCLFKKMGLIDAQSLVGTWQAGATALKCFLEIKLGINPQDIKIVDGSGLSRYNLVSPHQIVTALAWASQQPFFDSFLKSLAVVGIDGTLKNRMLDLSPKVKAKTGAIGGVSSLSGYIETSDQDTLIFSILINGNTNSSYSPKTEIEDAICKLLVDE